MANFCLGLLGFKLPFRKGKRTKDNGQNGMDKTRSAYMDAYDGGWTKAMAKKVPVVFYCETTTCRSTILATAANMQNSAELEKAQNKHDECMQKCKTSSSSLGNEIDSLIERTFK
ncbi:hypothetical protein D918_01173 [Trichuris suis]|nr:hypothetical protein D918_01173 [Trichuris suis]